MRRITIDIDTKNKRVISGILGSIFYLVEEIIRIDILKSNSKGYHIIIWTKRDYTENTIFKLREALGDDKKRIKIDRLRGYNLQTLFKEKIKNG